MKRTIGICASLILMSISIALALPTFSGNAPELLASRFTSAESNKQLSDIAKPLQHFQQNYQSSIQEAVYDQHLLYNMRQQIREQMQPHTMVPLFFQHINRLPQAERRQKLHDLQATVQSARTANTSGGISGRVMSEGTPVTEEVMVFAFDSHGYFAGSSKVDLETGEYAITNLKSDSFYVVTRSQDYIDEIYNDVASPLGSWQSWRQADKVFVSLAIVGGINFELNPGVPIQSAVLKPDGTPLEDGTVVSFAITTANDSTVIATRSSEISEGSVEILLPATGQFKILAAVEGYKPVWYPDQTKWQNAVVINIPDLTARPVIAFELQTETTGPSGAISGTVSPALFVVAAAFDAQDTTFAQLGISLGFLQVPYFIPDLPPGEYFVYADDYLGTLAGAGNYRGEFYDGGDGAYSVSQATKVTVVAEQETMDINFSLDQGGTIRGKVTDNSGAALDSLTIILVNADILESAKEPFLSRFELHVTSTDFNGDYEIPGLPANEYLLRTLSDFYINFDLAVPDSILLEGKHKNTVLDQYSGGEPNLFRIANVEPVVLENEGDTKEVNFTLQPANFIAGSVITSVDDMPVTDVTILALQDTSGYPHFPFAEIDSLGDYKLGPLPQGQYKVIALTGFAGEVELLSEYYNNQKSFYTAEVVNLSETMVENVNFELEPGATIEGFVEFPIEVGAAPETMPIVAFDTQTGYVASFDFVQFNGGFRLNRLLPGTYKVMTVPPPSDFAATYLGGGMAYSDESTEITLNQGEVSGNFIINLQTASGHITGTVTDSATGLPLSGVFVGAYDETGHLVGFDLTDFDVTGNQISNTGSYEIRGLRDGTYYVRTVAIFMAVALVDQATTFIGMFDNFDFFGFLFGDALTNLSLDVPIYKDQWHPNEPAGISIRLDELVYQASAYGLPGSNDNALLPIYAPLPFEEPVPLGAQLVQVNGGSAEAVDFVLAPGELDDLLSDVKTDIAEIPNDFVLSQNYPNPFNPSTTLSFSLPTTGQVDIRIFDTLGRQVKTLTSAEFAPGAHKITWDGRNDAGLAVSAGIYLVKMSSGDFQQSIKVVLVK